jgi:hypothetical protein
MAVTPPWSGRRETLNSMPVVRILSISETLLRTIPAYWQSNPRDRRCAKMPSWHWRARDRVAGPNLLGPADRRTGRMQRNVNGQCLGFGIEVPWSEVTRFEIAPFAWNIQLDVIVGG